MPKASNIAARPALLAVGALLVFAVGVALAGRATQAGAAYRPEATPIAERDLRFFDGADGSVIVQAADGHVIDTFQGEQGFLRGTLRSFVRTRHLDELGPQAPFQLTKWSDGRLTLDDPATHQHVELMAFGPTNAAVFAPLIDAP